MEHDLKGNIEEFKKHNPFLKTLDQNQIKEIIGKHTNPLFKNKSINIYFHYTYLAFLPILLTFDRPNTFWKSTILLFGVWQFFIHC